MQTVTLQFDTAQDVADFFARLGTHQMPAPVSATEFLAGSGASTATEVTAVEQTETVVTAMNESAQAVAEKKPRAPRKPKEEPASTLEQSAQTIKEINAEHKTLTIEDVRAALQGYVERAGEGGIKKGMELVATFGATRVSDLQPDQYADFIAKAKEKAAA